MSGPVTTGRTDLSRDEGVPGPRPRCGHGYYGAYLLGPDGNKIHAVYRGDIPPDRH